MKRLPRHPGFTLLELVLVMIIITTCVAIIAPNLRGWSKGAELKNSGEELLTLTRLARTKAITDGTIYRIEFNVDAGQYRMVKKQGTEFVELQSQDGRLHTILSGGKMELTVTNTEAAGPEEQAIDFYPTGRARQASVKISDGKSSWVQVAADSPAEDFKLVEGSGNS